MSRTTQRRVSCMIAIGWAAFILAPGFAHAQEKRYEPVPSEEIILTAKDGVRTAAYWYETRPSADAPVVILLHNAGSSHHAWEPFVRPLMFNGFSILSLDLRGHSKSGKISPESLKKLLSRDNSVFRAMRQDIDAAISWIAKEQHKGPERIVLIGGEFGSTLAIRAMSRDPKLAAVIAISPEDGFLSMPILESVKKIGDRPMFVITTKLQYYRGPKEISEIMSDNPRFKIKVFRGIEFTGIHLLNLNWNIEERMVKWMHEIMKATTP